MRIMKEDEEFVKNHPEEDEGGSTLVMCILYLNNSNHKNGKEIQIENRDSEFKKNKQN